jgi:hypothetical protein
MSSAVLDAYTLQVRSTAKMPDENVRDVVRRVRRSLQEKGASGAFLLQELDAALASGVRVRPESSSKERLSEDADGRSLNDAELLGILHSLFDTYLITLPSIASSLSTHLQRRFGVDHCEIALDRSLLEDTELDAGRARLETVVPSEPDVTVTAAVGEIRRMSLERPI